ncbi:MAG: hypothetical protein D6785_11345 [Planctomycetota bacterium]|nr:MAG: hypothetical protein D6785_11345 [Planctomycetota bacterium]
MKFNLAFFYVGNMDKAVSLYSRLLQVEPKTHADYPEWVEFPLEGITFALHHSPEKEEVSAPQKMENGAFLSLQVENIEEEFKRVKDLGFMGLGEITTESWGKLARVQDPWGNLFNICQYGE